MKNIIYVKLLNEGVDVYRPVLSQHIEGDIYQIGGDEAYDNEDEIWEYSPGSYVVVKKMNLEGRDVFVAIKNYIV